MEQIQPALKGNAMKKKIRQTLRSMTIGTNRADAETKALEIIRMGQEATDILIEMGWDALKGSIQGNRELLRAISFTLAVSLARKKAPAPPPDDPGINLLIKFAALGFNSARNGLIHLGISPKEIWQRHLMALPLAEGLGKDKEVSLSEALVEIELSQHMEGQKGPAKDRYCLGGDAKYRKDLFRIGKKSFALRSTKTR